MSLNFITTDEQDVVSPFARHSLDESNTSMNCYTHSPSNEKIASCGTRVTVIVRAFTDFGTLLRQQRLAAGMTQEALAERAGVSAKAISDLERDRNRVPRFDTVGLLADALGVDSIGRARLFAAARSENSARDNPPAQPVRTTGLPRPLTRLIGRADIVEMLAGLLSHHEARLLTLTGPGGVGKTRIAIAAAERAQRRFDNGIVFVDLSPLRDPNLVLASIALRLDIDERDRVPLNERLRRALRTKSMLLILDNFEHLVSARSDVLDLLEACPNVSVLITSRVSLRVRGEREVRIAPLKLPIVTSDPKSIAQAPSVAMFLDRARAVGVEPELIAETASTVADICARLDGLPLAIELAAAWTRLITLPVLLERLDQRLPVLIDGPHDLPARQRTMRDTIAWSYDLLGPSDQTLFRRLSLFTGGCTIVSAAEVFDEQVEVLLPGLLSLFDKSLIRSNLGDLSGDPDGRIDMLETLREFGLEKLEESGEATTLRRRHATHYLQLAVAGESALSGPDGLSWRLRIGQEHDNLRSALRWAIDAGESEMAQRLAGALWQFWSERAYVTEGRRWLREALAIDGPQETSSALVRAKALAAAALLAVEQADFDDALRLSSEAGAIARTRGASSDLVMVLNVQGLASREKGRYAEAFDLHQEAETLARTLNDESGVATSLTGLAYASLYSGDTTQAMTYADESISIFRRLGDARGLAEALMSKAAHVSHAGSFDTAEKMSREALELFEILGDTARMSDALWILGVTAQFSDQFARSDTLHRRCLQLRRDRGDEHGAVEPLTSLARIALHYDRVEESRSLLDETLVILSRFDDRWGRAMSLSLLGHVELATGDPDRARDRFRESISLHQEIGNPLFLSWCLEGIAGVAVSRGECEHAARLHGTRQALLESLGMLIPPAHPAGYEATLAAIHSTLNEDAFAREYDRGRTQTPEQAFNEFEASSSSTVQ